MKKIHNSLQAGNMVVFPQAEVLRGNAALRENRRCLGEYQPGAPDGAATQMNQVPIAGKAVFARILAHGGDEHTVADFQATDCQRRE